MTKGKPNNSRYWDYAHATLDAMKTQGLRPAPEIYHVWFVYFARENPEILHAIEQNPEGLGEEALLDLYYRFVFDRQAADFLRRSMDGLSGVMHDGEESLSRAADELKVYDDVLAHAQDKLESSGEKSPVIDTVALHTRRVRGTVASLSGQLSKHQARIEQLQDELERTRKRSHTDALTRVSNRLHFEEELSAMCRSADIDANAGPFCVMMVDLDQFKQINDRHGHRIGDEILVLIASTLRTHTRGRDIVARYGGDEFAILLPDTSLVGASHLAKDLGSRVRTSKVRSKSSGMSFGHVTVSIGVAEYIRDEGPHAVIDRADKALYTAKKAGRDGYCADGGEAVLL